jgi:kynurenine 3-monooxygenase
MKPRIVVGAGLVGSLLSVFLARRGYDVIVLERRPDMRREKISAGRSINLAISARGLYSLRQVGLEEEALGHAVPMRGRMIHAVTGELAFQPYGRDDSQCINSISRAWLNKALMSHAEATGRVEIRFRNRVADADLEKGVLEVHDEAANRSYALEAETVFGSDGSASSIRAAMQKRQGCRVDESLLSHGYKELHIPATEHGGFALEKHALHIWPRGHYMLIALPNLDGSFTCTLFLPFEGADSFKELTSPERLHTFFERQFPDGHALIADLERDFFENPTGQMVTVKTSSWNSGARALLLGDAAHAIVPFFGQGMNCGFEDCVYLDHLLGEAGAPTADVFECFSRERKPNADAIADMAVENFVEMRDRVADPHFLLEKGIERVLLNRFPGEFVSRYSLVSFSRAPYRFAYRAGEIASEIVHELSRNVSRPEEIDEHRAAELIRQRLAPHLESGDKSWT